MKSLPIRSCCLVAVCRFDDVHEGMGELVLFGSKLLLLSDSSRRFFELNWLRVSLANLFDLLRMNRVVRMRRKVKKLSTSIDNNRTETL